MFIMHISSLLASAVLVASAVLIIWSMRNEGAGSGFGKMVGSLVFVLSILSYLCIGYYGIKYWNQGEFETSKPAPAQMRMEMMEKMMPQMMEKMPQMMQGMMGGMKGGMNDNKGKMEQPAQQTGNVGEKKEQEHSHDHKDNK